MPPVVIGPTVAIIGLSLAGNAIGNSFGFGSPQEAYTMNGALWVNLICAIITLLTVVFFSVKGKKMLKLIPFILGIVAGYIAALIFTLIGKSTGNDSLRILDFSAFEAMKWVPEFTFTEAFKGLSAVDAKYIATIAVAYVPVAFVVFAEHIADHKNLSSIIGHDLLEDPGLHNTLLGDGIGSMVGAFFGGCPNTTYGESVGCVAITGNASVVTILATSVLAIAASFCGPFVTFLSTIPTCVMGGVCITLYGFIAVSGLKMLQPVDLNDNRNLFTASVILIAGIGGMTMNIGSVTLTEVACALILGVIVNLLFNRPSKKA
jgi:uracil permease